MLNKVCRRDFCEEVICDILRTKKHPFEKRRKEPFKHRGSMCIRSVARGWHVQTVEECLWPGSAERQNFTSCCKGTRWRSTSSASVRRLDLILNEMGSH